MDFSYTDEQEAVRELAERIFADFVSDERLRELESGDDWFDLALWKELAAANLPGLALPEAVGGGGLGFLEVCLVLEEMGRQLAQVPLFPTLVLGGLPLASFGSDEQRERWLAPVTRGDAVLSAALYELGSADAARPRTTARRDGDGWLLHGEKHCVPAAELASCILVPARLEEPGEPDAVGVFLLEPSAAGVVIERQRATHREPQGRLLLDGARVGADAVLGDPRRGADIVRWLSQRATVALCAIQLGVGREALKRTAAYTTERKQFDRAIATFQGVALRAADAFIDLDAMHSTCLQAAWRLDEGLPAELEVASAKWWACRGGQRVVHTAQHLHGGIGSDVDYPIHRFFLWSKQLELTLGGASQQLATLGQLVTSGAEAAARP